MKINSKLILNICFVISALTVFASSVFLYYQFVTDTYASDFAVHINTAVSGGKGYSLMHAIIILCYKCPHSEYVLSGVMAGITLLTAVAMYFFLIKRDCINDNKFICAVISLALLFASNINIDKYYPHYYDKFTTVSQPWHNTTYILMRLWAIIIIILYFKIIKKIANNEKVSIKEYLLFLIVLTLCNYSKPNFFLAFSPVVLVILIYYFFRNKFRNFFSILIFGFMFIFSMPILFFQTSVVFDEAEKSSIVLSTEYYRTIISEMRRENIITYIVCNICFPLIVITTMCFMKYVRKSNDIKMEYVIQSVLFYALAHIQQLFMMEDGPRKYDGNFSWGVYVFGLILFMVCISEWLSMYKRKNIKGWYFALGLMTFFVHIGCGILYYIQLLQGKFYII